MSKNFNINILNQNSNSKVISRGEIKKNIRISKSNIGDEGEIIVQSGTKGWVKWDGYRFIFEFDTPFKYPDSICSLYRLVYQNEKMKFKREVKCYEASNKERIEYLIENINIKRNVRGLKEINPDNIRFCLNMALTNNLDLEMTVQTYIDDIEREANSK